jgi:ElaA protein
MKLTWQIKEWHQLSTEELYEILALRTEVFIIEQNCPYQDTDGKDKKSQHVFAQDEKGKVHACARLVKAGVSYTEPSIGRVATSAAVRRTGAGKELMQRCMEHYRNQLSNPTIRISAQSYLKKFYSEFGFVQVSEEYLEDDIPHIEMLFTPTQLTA